MRLATAVSLSFAALIGGLAVSASAAPDPPAAADDPRAALTDLQLVYHQSCANRAYGSYNDMCAEMMGQIRAYQRQLAADARRQPPPAAARSSPPGAGDGEAAGAGPRLLPSMSEPAVPTAPPQGEP